MHDLRVVRAEVKTWERDFRSRYGRDPSVQDIRDQPAIAEKYKLYKKLNKAAATSFQPAAGPSPYIPSTPPHSHHSPRAVAVPRSRAVQSVAPLPGFNPFSPLKKKPTEKLSFSASQALRNTPSANPFATPAKRTSNHSLRPHTPSPDPFPSIVLPPQIPASSISYDSPKSNIAVSRARKRLRGEPVSPSPNKQKRQRVGSQLPRTFLLSVHSSSSDDEPDARLPGANFNPSFIDDSPVKPPAGGKSFKLLFEDALPTLSAAEPQTAMVKPATSRNATQPELRPISTTSQLKMSTKHGLDRAGFVPDAMQPIATSYMQYPLLPPSPPPQISASGCGGEYEARGNKPGTSRKRAKLSDDRDESDSPEEEEEVKVIVRNCGKQLSKTVDALALDPLLYLGARNHDPTAKDEVDANRHDSDTFTVDLPDKLRRVLAISPSRSHTRKEERVVRGLLNGDRFGHYDASKGGNIWDVGEWDDAIHVDTEAEDDWEGEPLPWELGEL
ncbi:hypothetical protein F5I97DRAFT_1810032 [Phlebopus sp. FC_14]|nr:hypothetical protein F5I97DRAFT_1810032 [Phlebopus sp. FC_14]